MFDGGAEVVVAKRMLALQGKAYGCDFVVVHSGHNEFAIGRAAILFSAGECQVAGMGMDQ